MVLIAGMPRTLLESGAVRQLGCELEQLGVQRPLLLTDAVLVACGILDRVLAALPAHFDRSVFDQIPENPTERGVEEALAMYRTMGCDAVVAIGGGSVIDSAKAVAMLAGHPGSLGEYYNQPQKITAAVAPLIVLPTTAGTGSEVTAGAGIHPSEDSRAEGIFSHHLVPKLALCDPDLTLSMPPGLTAGTGMDALSHCLEGYFSPAVNPLIDAVALDGMRRVACFIERAVRDGDDREARWQMMTAALAGGMSCAKGVGVAHALAMAFSNYHLHHGAMVAVAMPAVVRFLEETLGSRMEAVRSALGLAPNGDVAGALEKLNERVGLPGNLRDLGYAGGDLEEIVAVMSTSVFNRGSPRPPTPEHCRQLIEQVLA
jgi:alcohol dehydrogenase class IV